MYETVLIATDGSDRTRGAVAHGLSIAERYDAAVHALYIVDTGAVSFDEDGFSNYDEIVDILTKRGERATTEIARQAGDRGLDAETAVVQGTPSRGIRRYADEHEVDLLAMGTRGRGGIARRLLGSVSGSVLRKATQPVLVAGGTAANRAATYDRILLPTDGSREAARAADHAFDIAAHYGATVHALSVIDSRLIRSPGLLATLEGESDEALAAARKRGKETDIDVVTSVWRGTPHDCITSCAADREVDLVVMGAHEKRGLDRFLTQGVAERVVKTAHCPVLTLRK